MMMVLRENWSSELKTCQFLNVQDSEAAHRSAADFSFGGYNFSTNISQTDFSVHFQKEKFPLTCCSSFCKPCCIFISIISISDKLDRQGKVMCLTNLPNFITSLKIPCLADQSCQRASLRFLKQGKRDPKPEWTWLTTENTKFCLK